MAPSNSRQLLVWTLPTIAVLLSYFWYKRRRVNIEIDKNKHNCCEKTHNHNNNNNKKELNTPIKEKQINIPTQSDQQQQSPSRLFSRSLSGVDSSPIDIKIPSKLKSSKSNPVVISDEDLDLEIEKIKSMKYGNSIDIRKNQQQQQQQEVEKQLKPSSASSSSSSSSTATTPKKKLNNSPKEDEKKSPILKKQIEESNNNNKTIGGVESSPKSSVEMAQKIETQKQQQKPPTPPVVKNNPKKNKNNQERQVNDDLQKHTGERDSANHSPADVMMASPSLSCISDNHSEGSNDSGKGGSELNTPPPSRTPGTDDNALNVVVTENMLVIHQFVIPQILVGRLIGKNGSVVHMIKEKTGANIIVKKHPNNNKLKLCIVDGTQKEINNALKIIRDKFPLKRFPEITLENVCFVPEVATIPLIADHLYLKLVEGINNDTILSCMVTPNHLFLQQPTHPSFPNLNILTGYMDVCYSETDSPLLPSPIPQNTVCAAFSVDHWLRATILSTDIENDTSYVKFLDYGGFAYVPNANLRQIRGDFMLLPFQAAECCLACVKPTGEGDVWPQEAYDMVGNITKGTIIYTQVVDYTEDGVPLVYCYLVIENQLVFLNQELVNQGYAEWINTESTIEPPSQNNVENIAMAASTSSSSNSNYFMAETVAEA